MRAAPPSCTCIPKHPTSRALRYRAWEIVRVDGILTELNADVCLPGGWKADLHTMTFSDIYAADLLPTINHVFVPALALIKKMIDYKFGPGQLVETFGYPKLVKYCADKGGKQRGTVLHTDGADIAYTISLSPPSHYGGGGTFFKELGGSIRPAQGRCGNACVNCSQPLHSVSWIRYIGNSLLWIGAAQGL